MLLYIIRHGEPIYEPDILTELGHKEADAVAERLAIHGLDRVFCSPLGRARQTAEPTCKKLGLEAQIEPWTREIWPELALTHDDGSMEFAMSVDNTVYRQPEVRALGNEWYKADFLKSIDGKGVFEWLAGKSDDFMLRLGFRHEGNNYRVLRKNDERVALFCHAGFTLAWLSYLLMIPPQMFWSSFDITHSGITILEWKTDREITAPRCLMMSDMSHFMSAGLEMKYNNKLDI